VVPKAPLKEKKGGWTGRSLPKKKKNRPSVRRGEWFINKRGTQTKNGKIVTKKKVAHASRIERPSGEHTTQGKKRNLPACREQEISTEERGAQGKGRKHAVKKKKQC